MLCSRVRGVSISENLAQLLLNSFCFQEKSINILKILLFYKSSYAFFAECRVIINPWGQGRNPLTLQSEQSGGQGLIQVIAQQFERHDKGSWDQFHFIYFCHPNLGVKHRNFNLFHQQRIFFTYTPLVSFNSSSRLNPRSCSGNFQNAQILELIFFSLADVRKSKGISQRI